MIRRFIISVALLVTELRAAPPPVILISVDTLRADHLSSFGYTHLRTPNIDSFAQGGTLYANIDGALWTCNDVTGCASVPLMISFP